MAQLFPKPVQHISACNSALGVVAELCVPKAFHSEIQKLLISEVDSADRTLPKYFPADPTDAADWASAINNSGTGIKQFDVVGAIPKPAENVNEDGGYLRQLQRTWQFTGRAINVSYDNYEFARSLQSGAELFAWFLTADNQLIGATAVVPEPTYPTLPHPADYWPYGIKVQVRDFHPDLPEGANSLMNLAIVLEWKERVAPPIYDGVSPISVTN